MKFKYSFYYLCASVPLWLYLPIILFLLFTISSANPSIAYSGMSYHVSLHSSLEEDIQTLQSMGYMDEIFTGFRPYSRLEAARAIVKLRSQGEGGQYPQSVMMIIARLKRELKDEIEILNGSAHPVVDINQLQIQTIFLDGTFTNRGLGTNTTYKGLSIKNFGGRPYENGLNMYGDITLTAHPYDSILFYLNPEFQYLQRDVKNEDEVKRVILQDGYVKYHTSLSDIIIGKVPLWWGQGYNGTLILSDNMAPLIMVRLYKESPFEIALPFKQKGLISYDFFVSELEHDRELPNPIFWGLRLGFKPFPSWEIGIARTAIFGGGNRPVNLNSILNSVTGLGENTPKESGDQIAGIDTSYKGRLWKQSFLIYGEMYGEDQANWLPYKNAVILGLYLPEIFDFPENSLRVEYANDAGFLQSKLNDVWYTHHIYTDGYTYKGRIMGYGMGTDADNFLLKWEKYISADAKGFLSFERNRLGIFKPAHWEIRDYTAGVELNLLNGRALDMKYTLQKVDNAEFNPSKDFENHEVWVNVRNNF